MEKMVKKNKNFANLVDPIVSKEELINTLKRIGIQKGSIVFVEANLNKFNNVVGGNRTLIEALQELVTYDGCIVCSGKTTYNVDLLSSDMINVDFDKIATIRESMPPFNKKLSLPDNSFAQSLLQYDGAIRSNHPIYSFIAWGKYSKLICDKHQLHFAYGQESAMSKVKDLDGKVLMIGTKFEDSDLFKMLASMDENIATRIISTPIEKKGSLQYVDVLEKCSPNYDTLAIKKALDDQGLIKITNIGNAKAIIYHLDSVIKAIKEM